MNDILKQRLVGALILVALGVVFWPIIFVEPVDKIAVDKRTIPPPPAVSTADIEAPGQTGLRASPEPATTGDDNPTANPEGPDNLSANATSDQGPSPQEAPAAATSSAKPSAPSPATLSNANSHAAEARAMAPESLTMDKVGVPVAWTLQVATVSSAEKADDIRRQLLVMKQKAYVTTVRAGGKSLYRVCIGPKFERAELEKLQAGINARYGVQSLVVRYLP